LCVADIQKSETFKELDAVDDALVGEVESGSDDELL